MFQTRYYIEEKVSFLKIFKRWRIVFICQDIAPFMSLESYKFKYTNEMRVSLFANMIDEFKNRITFTIKK